MFRVQTQMSQADENGMCKNDCQDKPNTAEWLAKPAWAAFQFLKKLVVKHNFGTNYVQQPRLQCVCVYI